MPETPPRQDIDFVIAQGEALVERARSMVQQWEQNLLKAGITPEMAERLQQGLSEGDLRAIAQAQAHVLPGPADAGHLPESLPDRESFEGPSLLSSRRAIRRLRHI